MTDSHSNPTLPRFPPDFLWGAATSAYQAEGSSESRGEVVWDSFLAAGGGYRGDVALKSSDHIRNLERDLDLISELGLKSYRFSISWARVMPDARTPAAAGLDFYERLVDGLLARGIVPNATLHHLDPPAALGEAGWAQRTSADRFAEYAAYVTGRLGDRVELWATLNEPMFESLLGHYDGSWPPGEQDLGRCIASLHHKLLGHARAATAIKAGHPRLKVGLVNSYSPGTPASDDDADRAAVSRVDAFINHYLLDPLFRGSYPAQAVERYQQLGAFGAVVEDDLALIKGTADFLGVNYYNIRHLADATSLGGITDSIDIGYNLRLLGDLGIVEVPAPDGIAKSALGWPIEPDGLHQALTQITHRYGKIPLYVTENGVALHDYVNPEGAINDEPRIDYLKHHIAAIEAAIADGVDVRGYYAWSLLDNLEWNLGYAPRFGLIYVDLPTGARYPKRSYGWYRDFIAAQRAAADTGAAYVQSVHPPSRRLVT